MKRKLKIAVWHNLGVGGARRHLSQHVNGLVERGHHIEVWSPSSPNKSKYGSFNRDVIEHYYVVPEAHFKANTFLGRCIYPYTYARRQRALCDKACTECAQAINQGDFDVLFATTCQIRTVSPMGQLVDVPSVLYLHEPNRRLYESLLNGRCAVPVLKKGDGSLFRNIQSYIRGWSEHVAVDFHMQEESRNAANYNLILVNSYYSREITLRTYGLDSEVHYTGVDLSQWVNNRLKREPFVLGVGSFNIHKNIPFLIRSLECINKEVRPRLVWIGNSGSHKYVSRLKEYAEACEVGFQVLYDLTDKELIDYYNRAGVMVFYAIAGAFWIRSSRGECMWVACGCNA